MHVLTNKQIKYSYVLCHLQYANIFLSPFHFKTDNLHHMKWMKKQNDMYGGYVARCARWQRMSLASPWTWSTLCPPMCTAILTLPLLAAPSAQTSVLMCVCLVVVMLLCYIICSVCMNRKNIAVWYSQKWWSLLNSHVLDMLLLEKYSWNIGKEERLWAVSHM